MKQMTSDFGELTVTYPKDCGNAPKKLVLRDFHIAVAQNDIDFISEQLTDDSKWELIGQQQIEGKQNMLEAIEQMGHRKILKLEIDHIITHGKITSINGHWTLDNEETYAFCHVHVFNNFSKQAKIKKTTSYVIQTSS